MNEPTTLPEDETPFTEEDYANPLEDDSEDTDVSRIPAEHLARFSGPPLEGEEETLRNADKTPEN